MRSDRIAEAVGHDGLAEAVREFAHGWDDRRTELTRKVRALAAAAATTAQAFTEVDAELARALEEPAR